MKKKKCPRCGRKLNTEKFSKSSNRTDGLEVYCKECKKKYSRKYYKINREKILKQTQKCYKKNIEKNRDKRRLYSNEYYQKNKKRILLDKKNKHQALKLEVINHYGGKCECCGEKEILFLTIDHINGGGNNHRKIIGYSKLYYWLKKNNYPKGYRVLCFNCNCVLGFTDVCPHKK